MRTRHFIFRACLTSFLGVGACTAVHAQTPAPAADYGVATAAVATAPTRERWALWDRATGDWGQTRPALESRGVRVEGFHTSDWSTAVGGGDSAFAARGLLDLRTTIDLRALPGDTAVSAQLLSKRGGDGALVGRDLQGYSNIDADSFTRLGELWVEQAFGGGAFRVKAGRVDANSEFARNELSGDFLNSSMGYSPTILLPTYPNPTPSVNLFVRPLKRLDVGVGVYHRTHGETAPENLVGDGLFTITEAGWSWGGDTEAANRVAIGYWRHTGDFHAHNDAIEHGAEGLHFVADQWIRRVGAGEAGSVTAFLKVGISNTPVTPFDRHVGGGAAWVGPFEAREDDALGFGATWVRGRDEDGVTLRELALGPFYRVQVTPWAALTPDVQVIRTIDGPDARGLRVAITCRAVVSF